MNWIDSVWLLGFGFGAIGWGIFGRSFQRRGRGLDPHPNRIRAVLIGIGLAILLLWLSEVFSPH